MTRRFVSRLTVLTLVLVLVVLCSANAVIAGGTPSIYLSRTSGPAGTSVSVSGFNFGLSESGITVTFDGVSIVSGLFADGAGVWSATFTVPPVAGGVHYVDAYGSATSATTVPDQPFTIYPTITASRTSGPAGTQVTVTGAGFLSSESGVTITWDGTAVGSGTSASSQGAWSSSFTVPSSPAGSHIIDAYGASSSSASVPDLTFTVSAGIAISRTSGAPGTSITVTGSGFGASETGITVTYDGNQVATGVTANTQGGFTATFVVPSSTAGSHVIDAFGSVTQAASVADQAFSISPTISINRTSGMSGSSVTVSGSGFGANETGIVITYDGQQVATGITANSEGIWNANFVVPQSASGSHTIDAKGSSTAATSVPDVTYSIGPTMSTNRTSGPVGTSVTISGSGFGANETGITITYDGDKIGTTTVASPQGVWSTSVTIPESAAGNHSIKAYGSVTQMGSAGEAAFSVTPTLSLNPSTGSVGGTVEVSGNGFAANSALKFYYDDNQVVPEAVNTDARGGFTKSVTIPKSPHGPHTIRVTDAQKNDLKMTFVMESTPPPVPTPVAPEDGAKMSIAGGITPAFRWTEVKDPSGVSYNLQIDTTQEFFQPVLEKADLTRTTYTLTATEALPQGSYYWRVRAADAAGNNSAWTQPRLLKSGIMAMWMFVMIIVAAVGALAGGGFFLIRGLKGRKREAAVGIPEPEMPQIVSGQWRSVESSSEEPARERPLPFRLALPQPTKAAKPAFSTEDQARLKVIMDFAQSLPLVEPGYTVDWLIEMLESSMGIEASLPIYEQLVRGELQVRYEPAWMHHPTYQDLTTILEGQPVLQDLSGFVDSVNRCATEGIQLLQDIYRDSTTEIRTDFLQKGGWGFASAIYADAICWFLGKSLREPSDRDYSIKPRLDEGGGLWLYGEPSTCFALPLIQAADEKEGQDFRSVHLKIRRAHRNNARARQLVSMLTQLEIQRSRLLGVLSQISRLKQ